MFLLNIALYEDNCFIILFYSEGDGVTSVWEVYRQNPYYYSDRVPEGSSDKREQRNTWYGMPSSTGSEPSERRPQSIHIGSSEYTNLEYQPWLSRKQTERNLFDHSLSENNFEGSTEADKHKSNYRASNSPSYKDSQHFTEIQGDFSLDKKGMYLSRSLSSSFSSYIGSSDEKEDSQGIYSAYDVASRSPYESMVSRRYSQSSLSSSNASWHQHQGPTPNYNVRDIPPLLDPLTSKTSQTRKSSSNYRDIPGEFQAIKESVPPAVLPKPGKFSSSYTIQLHASKPKESPIWVPNTNRVLNTSKGGDQTDNKGPTVREIARKFTPASVRHISSVCTSQEEDRIIKAETSPSMEKSYNELSPPKATDDKIKGVVMRQKEPSNKTPEELASHRLSLQELIQLHEEQIAIQAKSAKTNLAHVYVKRSPDVSPLKSTGFDGKVSKSIPQHENAKVSVINSEMITALQAVDNQASTTAAEKEHGGYEVREVVVSQSSPFKVIELTDKASNTLKGRASRLKRHRTIGIVGYRHQIDRTSGEKVETKLKRHTTVGIVSDFPDSSELLAKSKELLPTEDQNVSPLRNADINRVSPVENIIKQDNSKKPFPVKVFDIDSNVDHENIQDTIIPSEEMVAEQPIQSVTSERWFSKPLPDKHFLEWENENKFSTVNHECSEKASGTASSITLREPQQDIVPARSTRTDKYQTTINDSPSRNSHSPVVELLPEREGNTAAYYKSGVNYSHSHPKDAHLDTANHRHHLNTPKTHLVPVAHISPVSHSFGSQDVDEHKSMPLASPPPEPPSAHEMYQTRLALWDLLPHKRKSNSDLSEHQSNEGHFSVGEHSKPSSHSIEKLPAVKYIGQSNDNNNPEAQQSRLSLNFERLEKTEEYYFGVIEKLKGENQRLKEKNESEKREFKRMYEEQKKVANAYQKLEDRYRRRVHELQDALASCTCQGSLMAKENNFKSSHLK